MFHIYNLPKSSYDLASEDVKISEITDPGILFLFNYFHPFFQITCYFYRRENFLIVFGLWIQWIHSCTVQDTALLGQEAKKPAKRHSQALRNMYRSRHGLQRSAKFPSGCCVCNQWYSTQAQRHLVREYLYWFSLSYPGSQHRQEPNQADLV